MGTAGPSVLSAEEQQANISAAHHANTVRATISAQCQADRRWEVWGPVAKGIGLAENGHIRFNMDSNFVLHGQCHVLSPAYCLGPGDAEDDGYQGAGGRHWAS